jgi:DNA-binding response OmpR family regulator
MMSNGERISVVDDDRDLVEATQGVLDRNGFRVNTAKEPQTGLSKAQTDRPDPILLDVMMATGTEGFHFVWKIRNLPEEYSQNVPIIIPASAEGCGSPGARPQRATPASRVGKPGTRRDLDYG